MTTPYVPYDWIPYLMAFNLIAWTFWALTIDYAKDETKWPFISWFAITFAFVTAELVGTSVLGEYTFTASGSPVIFPYLGLFYVYADGGLSFVAFWATIGYWLLIKLGWLDRLLSGGRNDANPADLSAVFGGVRR